MLFECAPPLESTAPSSILKLDARRRSAPQHGSSTRNCSSHVGIPSNTEKEQHCEKKIQHSPEVEELLQALGNLNLERDYWMQTAARVKSASPIERFEGTRQFRMMLSVSGEIPIQEVIDTGVVPCLVSFISQKDNPSLQFEAAWALTNIASGTYAQTQVVVEAGAIPHFIELLDSHREDIREQGMWGLGNIAGDRPEYRDVILSYSGSIIRFVNACRRSCHVSSMRTGVWSLSNLCRGKPRPKLSAVAPAIPYLSHILSLTEDPDTLSDACWALDGLSEHQAGVAALVAHNVVPLLVKLLKHKEPLVQRPALRVTGQVAAGDVEQTQAIIDNDALMPLHALLHSPKKTLRKDACWTLSNIAAGSPSQLQALLDSGVIAKLVEVFEQDGDLDVKKEAAWAICNACTTQQQEQLQYLIAQQCIRPVCEMLCIDDVKILIVALEALENVLQFGERMMMQNDQPIKANVCLELVKSNDGFTRLYHLHTVCEGYGNFDVWRTSGRLLERWVSSNLLAKRSVVEIS